MSRKNRNAGKDASASTGGCLARLWRGIARVFAWIFKPLNTFADNLKLHTKMLLLSVTCVLIPVVATNSILLFMMYSAEQERIESQMKDVYINTENQLNGLRQSLSTMTATLYTNSGLYQFLDTEYADNLEYYEAYRAYIEPLSVVYGNNTYISNFVLYSDNDTITNGGGVTSLSSVKDTEWYRYYKESGAPAVVYSYYDDTRDMRTVSLIRKLDYIKDGLSKRERLIKLDISYGYYNRILSQQQTNTDIYICDDRNIIFSNTDPSNGVQPFGKLSDIDVPANSQTFVYKLFGTEWKVYLLQSEESIDLSLASIIEGNWPLLMVLILVNLLLPISVIFLISRSITSRLRLLASHLEMVKDERFEEITQPQSRDELGDLARHYNHMTHRMRELIEDVYKERLQSQENELQKQRAELRALHSQINPHFMFNALESIRMRSIIKEEHETAEIIEMLAIMMRKSTDWGDDMVTISSEASFAETYLKLQRYRFGERLSYRINIAPDCADCLVPKLSIVTFVENACVHGVEGVKRGCIIILSVERDEDALRIYIEDTGAGMSEEKCAVIMEEMRRATFDDLHTSKSVGIINACLRLKKCFGSDVGFELDSEEDAGLCITITIPIDRISKKEGE